VMTSIVTPFCRGWDDAETEVRDATDQGSSAVAWRVGR
jgi:hypothetical protein